MHDFTYVVLFLFFPSMWNSSEPLFNCSATKMNVPRKLCSWFVYATCELLLFIFLHTDSRDAVLEPPDDNKASAGVNGDW